MQSIDDFRRQWLNQGGQGGTAGSYADPNNTAIYSDNNAPSIGGIPIWKLQQQYPAGPQSNQFNLNTLGQSTGFGGSNNMLEDTLESLGGAKAAANMFLKGWGAYNQHVGNKQNQQYLDSVDKAMVFDQADVNRRWNLGLADYKVAENDLNAHRVAQGMKPQYANV
jgi:hypothetical protein